MSPSLASSLISLRGRALRLLETQHGTALLLGRLAVGLLFVSTGWGKVHNLANVAGFFESLGIPAPGFHAVLVSYTELLCGTALVIGLFTRLAAVPLSATMIVALATAKRDDIGGLLDLVSQDELTYLVVLVMLGLLGPGRHAVDHWIARRLDALQTGVHGEDDPARM